MPNYIAQASTSPGITWRRSNHVAVHNEFSEVPHIEFFEEDMVWADTGPMKQAAGRIIEFMLDPTTSFSLLDPTTGAPTGTATYQDAYNLLYSLYFHLATKRDAGV